MKTFMILFLCVLCCYSKFALCNVVEQEGTSMSSPQCLDINMQVENEIDDILTVTEKIKGFYLSNQYSAGGKIFSVLHDVNETCETLSPREKFFTNLQRIEKPSRYSIGMHFRSHDLMVTLNVAVVKCEAHNRTGRSENGKILTRKGGVQISLDYNSSASYSYHSGADKTRTMLQWITWPFKSLANVLAVLFNCLVDIALKTSHCVVWPFRFLKNQIVALYKFVTGLCSSLDQKIQKQFEDPLKIIEAVLEVIWMVVSPFVRAVTWLCEIIVTVKRYIKFETALFLEAYPGLLGYITTCTIIGEYLSKLLALWPWNWMDSIEYVGYNWVILYISYALIKFAMMDERKMLRLARHSDRHNGH